MARGNQPGSADGCAAELAQIFFEKGLRGEPSFKRLFRRIYTAESTKFYGGKIMRMLMKVQLHTESFQ